MVGQVAGGPDFCCLSIWVNLEMIREMDCYKMGVIFINLPVFYYSNDYVAIQIVILLILGYGYIQFYLINCTATFFMMGIGLFQCKYSTQADVEVFI